jgi:hypothetical protein
MIVDHDLERRVVHISCVWEINYHVNCVELGVGGGARRVVHPRECVDVLVKCGNCRAYYCLNRGSRCVGGEVVLRSVVFERVGKCVCRRCYIVGRSWCRGWR